MVCVEPRSTWIHCGSENCDDQRVPVFPSTAFEAGNAELSRDEAVAGLLRARFVVAQLAAAAFCAPSTGTSRPASRAARAATSTVTGLPRGMRVGRANDSVGMTLLLR